MATCPNCLVKSREKFRAMEITIAGPAVTDGEMRFYPVATTPMKLSCNECGWHVYGYIQDGTFYADPTSQVKPREST